MVLAQFFRAISSVFEIIADRENNTKKIFLYNGIYNLLCSVQYFLLGAFTGGICSILAIVRNIIFLMCKNKKTLFVVLPIYFLAVILISIGEFDGLISVIPILLIMMYSTALAIGNVYLLKYVIILVMLLEMFYDYYCKAYVGILVCLVDIVIVSISIVKLKKELKK